ncbi:hypothetical protein PCK1_000336 [Pneumocystis canis]|nr:hypothetical protein PCK1_000336 [Pneumocystis canis]
MYAPKTRHTTGSYYEIGFNTTRLYSRSHSVPLSVDTVPICQNCSTSITPLWRRDESGATLCNACGLFLKLHGCARPTSLKTDTIKSRNRVKGAGHHKPKSQDGLERPTRLGTLSPPLSPRESIGPAASSTGSFITMSSASSVSSVSSMTPMGSSGHPDSEESRYSLPSLGYSSQTMATESPYHHQTTHSTKEPPTIDSLLQANAALRTRVSELELVNDLFRSRVSELEMLEVQMKRQDASLNDLDHQLRQREADLERREAYLHMRIKDIRHELEQEEQQKRKKIRVSELLEETESFLINALPIDNESKDVKVDHPILTSVP